MNINERIEKIIAYSGYNSSEFADEIDVQRSSISHITSGRNKPSLEFITKIKNRFPEINWDWIILGTGEMNFTQQSPTSEFIEKIGTEENSSTPDLFTLIDDESFGVDENKVQENISTRDFNISLQSPIQENISDSQRLEVQNNFEKSKVIDNQLFKSHDGNSAIKKIVFFYENGKFEIFEP